MGVEAIDLLANVGLVGEQDGLLVEAVGIEGRRGIEKRGDLLGKARADGIGGARRRRFGRADEPLDIVQPGAKDRGDGVAFPPADDHQVGKGFRQVSQDQFRQPLARLLVRLHVRGLHDPADGQDAIERRRLRPEAVRRSSPWRP